MNSTESAIERHIEEYEKISMSTICEFLDIDSTTFYQIYGELWAAVNEAKVNTKH